MIDIILETRFKILTPLQLFGLGKLRFLGKVLRLLTCHYYIINRRRNNLNKF